MSNYSNNDTTLIVERAQISNIRQQLLLLLLQLYFFELPKEPTYIPPMFVECLF